MTSMTVTRGLEGRGRRFGCAGGHRSRKAVDTTHIKDPVIGFVFDQKGPDVNLTLEGSKFSKLDKK